jgi:hypothetical protein
MKKLLLVLLLYSASAQADNDWVAPLFGGILIGNVISRPYYVPPPVYYAPPVYYQQPPVYYQPQPQIYYSNEYYREQEVRRRQRYEQERYYYRD